MSVTTLNPQVWLRSLAALLLLGLRRLWRRRHVPRVRRDLNSRQLTSLRFVRQRAEEALVGSIHLANPLSTAYWQSEACALRRHLARVAARARALCEQEELAALHRRHLPTKACRTITREELSRRREEYAREIPGRHLRRFGAAR